MENLLEKHGYDSLIRDVSFNDVVRSAGKLAPMDHLHCSKMLLAAMAYHIGVKQGVHNERARRRAKTNMTKEIAI